MDPEFFLVVKFVKPNNILFGKLLKDGSESVNFRLFVQCLARGHMSTSPRTCPQALAHVFVVVDDDWNRDESEEQRGLFSMMDRGELREGEGKDGWAGQGRILADATAVLEEKGKMAQLIFKECSGLLLGNWSLVWRCLRCTLWLEGERSSVAESCLGFAVCLCCSAF